VDIIRFDYGTGESDEEGEGDDEGGEGGGGKLGEKRKSFSIALRTRQPRWRIPEGKK